MFSIRNIFPFDFQRIFYMIFCSFSSTVHDGFWFGTWFFYFFLKVDYDICLVVFSVLVIFILFLIWILVFLFCFVNDFFMKQVNYKQWHKSQTYICTRTWWFLICLAIFFFDLFQRTLVNYSCRIIFIWWRLDETHSNFTKNIQSLSNKLYVPWQRTSMFC
jgi:hypothetical protein